ncbi:nucleoside-diphosphate-sugar epimerase [Microbacterium immunditiarum]|uniref:Nucleoside-diphosphate-sugar epimerase n=1 Tax=Microbacterium immunditiarum TaxID=337480 RepID=A0A7Y9GK91_9MICO|nr:nucleoside-diphosphate-sugar epimerase [Microbacterium immunditiarum]
MAAERAAEELFPGRLLTIRPGWVFGPGNTFPPSTYLAARAARGGEMLVAGDEGAIVQFLDVRDLASWLVLQIEAFATGLHNLAGPVPQATLGDVVGELSRAFGTRVEWVGPEWFIAQPERHTLESLLFWTDQRDDTAETHRAGFLHTMRNDIGRARQAGLVTRPGAETLIDAARWLELELGGVDGQESRSRASLWPRSTEWEHILDVEQSLLSRRGRLRSPR